jgi:hypothetical protein
MIGTICKKWYFQKWERWKLTIGSKRTINLSGTTWLQVIMEKGC